MSGPGDKFRVLLRHDTKNTKKDRERPVRIYLVAAAPKSRCAFARSSSQKSAHRCIISRR
ncbi:MAG: hypothetical protein OZSIB_0956 [Candidatus Ozemobacter sibiricus]|uniref:Uncharacterized protein n=1 Tax=Candidatus Ozemobacter sibiricus TaxID=2268124 RepID=A0A367ZL32_9BACT|nr:MAG: hypothetical protein OZSIB_0956 [Candidatus Ozemobacter sibiricus]